MKDTVYKSKMLSIKATASSLKDSKQSFYY